MPTNKKTLTVTGLALILAAGAAHSGEDAGLPMKEIEKWIKRELPREATTLIVTRYKDGKTYGTHYEMEKADLDECVLTLRQSFRPDVVDKGQTHTSRLSLKDLAVGQLKTVEDAHSEETTSNRPIYSVYLVALADRGKPFQVEIRGLGVDKSEASASVRVRVSTEAAGLHFEGLMRRAAVLCGAPEAPASIAASHAGMGPRALAEPELGKYFRRGKEADYFELAADGKCRFVIDGRSAGATCQASGENLMVSFPNGKDRATARLGDGSVTFADTVWEKPGAGRKDATPVGSAASTKMTNLDVIQLVNAGLSELVIANSIRQATAREFDLSPAGLVALKKAKVSDSLIVAMQATATLPSTPVPPTPTSPPKYDSSLSGTYAADKAASAQASIGCTGVEAMGLYKNEIFDRAMGGGITEWLAKIRNSNSVTKIVVFSWRDQYGQRQSAQVQIRGGDIASPRVDMSQAKFIAPVKDLQLVSCQ